jgi:hypothetical protein
VSTRGGRLTWDGVDRIRWSDGTLELEADGRRLFAADVPSEDLVLLGPAFRGVGGRARLRHVAVRLPAGTRVTVEVRDGRCAVAAGPTPRAEGQPRPGAGEAAAGA